MIAAAAISIVTSQANPATADKAGKIPGHAMPVVMNAYDEKQIASLSAWLATQTNSFARPGAVHDKAAECAACHTGGDHGLASLAGRPAPGHADVMRAFNRGAMQGAVMPTIAKVLSDAEIDAITAYFATLKK